MAVTVFDSYDISLSVLSSFHGPPGKSYPLIRLSFMLGVFLVFLIESFLKKNVFTTMVDDYGIPPWAGYLIFGLITILIGLILGLVSCEHIFMYDSMVVIDNVTDQLFL